MDVTWFGKAGTFGMMVAFPAFLASADPSLSDTASTAFLWLAWLSGIPGLVFGMIAFVGYLPAGLRALQDGRRARSAVAASGGR
jgi:hypothetical protein